MRAAQFFAEAKALPLLSLTTVTRGGGIVIVAPHPDDESLGCGGLIAAAVAANMPVRVVVVSDGVGSHPKSRRYPPDALRVLRETETYEAAAILGLAPSCISFLRLPDAAVPIAGPDADAACASVAAACTACCATTICVTWPFDPHCDHVASASLVDRAMSGRPGTQILHYPVWGWTLPPDAEVPGPADGFRLDIEVYRHRKAAAIAAHRSQTTALIEDDPDGFRLQPEMIANFSGPVETYFHATRLVR